MHLSLSSVAVGLASLLAISQANPLPEPQSSGSSGSTPAKQSKPGAFGFNFNPARDISKLGIIPEELRVERYCIPFHMQFRCDSPDVCRSEFRKPPVVQRQVMKCAIEECGAKPMVGGDCLAGGGPKYYVLGTYATVRGVPLWQTDADNY
ncbi:MAG: hypothetical protein M1823_003969 [Watsoniomyces obsoletus]|nr:MAG: hypothetical protein M1823_003969 [Watsoniomyces obsoletus]